MKSCLSLLTGKPLFDVADLPVAKAPKIPDRKASKLPPLEVLAANDAMTKAKPEGQPAEKSKEEESVFKAGNPSTVYKEPRIQLGCVVACLCVRLLSS